MIMTVTMMTMRMIRTMAMRREREKGEERREGRKEGSGAPSLQNEDPTPQDGWEKTMLTWKSNRSPLRVHFSFQANMATFVL